MIQPHKVPAILKEGNSYFYEFLYTSGSIHYPRSTHDIWDDLMRKAKAGELDVIDTGVFWNVHEHSPRKFLIIQRAVQGSTEKVVGMMRSEWLFASQGGPIILSQTENEYGSEVTDFGAAGKAYIYCAVKMADGLKTGIVWLMCKEDDAPEPIVH